MSDDIVTHLRNQHELKKLAYPELCKNTKTIYEEAADEIERLRAQVNTIANAQDGWGRVTRLKAEIERLLTELENVKAENQRLSQVAKY